MRPWLSVVMAVVAVGLLVSGYRLHREARRSLRGWSQRQGQLRQRAERAETRARAAEALALETARSVNPDSFTVTWLPETSASRRRYARVGVIRELSQYMQSRNWHEVHGVDRGPEPHWPGSQRIEVTAFGGPSFLFTCDARVDLPDNDGCILLEGVGHDGFTIFTRRAFAPVVTQ
jgi:hypothetical protein